MPNLTRKLSANFQSNELWYFMGLVPLVEAILHKSCRIGMAIRPENLCVYTQQFIPFSRKCFWRILHTLWQVSYDERIENMHVIDADDLAADACHVRRVEFNCDLFSLKMH